MREAGLAWAVAVALGLLSAPFAGTRKINTCMTFRGRLGDDANPKVWQYTNPSIKTKNLEEVDLPDPVVTKVIDMVENSAAYKETGSGSDAKTTVETTQWEGSEEDPDAHYDGSDSKGSSGSGSGAGSRSNCIPRPSKTEKAKPASAPAGASGSSSKKDKKGRKCVWPKKKSKKKKLPYCDELTTKPPKDKRRPVTFVIERTTEKKGAYSFTVSVNETIRETTQTYTQDRVYTIKVTKGKLYTITMAKAPTPTDLAERSNINNLYQVISSFYGQSTTLNKETYNFDAVTTIVWSKVDGHYRLVEIDLVTITCLEDLCGDTIPYTDYRKRITSKEHAKSKETTADIIKKDSPQYQKLFSSEDSFKFSNWFKIYTSTVIPGDFAGEKFKVTESFKNVEEGQVRFIKIIWDPKANVKSFTMIAFLFSRSGGNPVITIKDFGSSNQGVASYQVFVRYFRRTSALALNVTSMYVTVSQESGDDVAGELEIKFNYTYVKTVHEFNLTAQSAYAESRRRRSLEANNQPYWRQMLSYFS